jgi:hypothetical protein
VSPGAAERYRAAAGSATIAGARSSKYRVYDSQILNHVVVANAQATMIANPTSNVVDGNDWWVAGAQPAAATWQWKNTTHQGFAAYRRATASDAHSRLPTRDWVPAGGRRRDRPRSTRGSTRRWPDHSTSTARRGARAARSTSAPWSTAPDIGWSC